MFYLCSRPCCGLTPKVTRYVTLFTLCLHQLQFLAEGFQYSDIDLSTHRKKKRVSLLVVMVTASDPCLPTQLLWKFSLLQQKACPVFLQCSWASQWWGDNPRPLVRENYIYVCEKLRVIQMDKFKNSKGSCGCSIWVNPGKLKLKLLWSLDLQVEFQSKIIHMMHVT